MSSPFTGKVLQGLHCTQKREESEAHLCHTLPCVSEAHCLQRSHQGHAAAECWELMLIIFISSHVNAKVILLQLSIPLILPSLITA